MKRAWLIVLGVALAGCGGLGLHPIRGHQADRLVDRGDALRRAGSYQAAADTYRRAVAAYAGTDAADRALLGLARVYAAPGNPGRDYRQAYEHFDRLLREAPRSPWADEAQAWRDALATLFAQQDQLAQSRREADRLRREAQRDRQDAERIRDDLDRLRQRELELERPRSP